MQAFNENWQRRKQMRTVYLNRFESTDQGTIGIWACPEFGYSCFCMELPWRDNTPSLSCIPPGEYTVQIRWSRKYKWHYHITNVDGRSWILVHSGNYAGDIKKGYKTHSQGCLLLGKSLGYLNGQRAVLNSRIKVREFFNLMNQETFKLFIS